MATTPTRRQSTPTRHTSALSAARAGWHKWATRHWGWFTPVLVIVGMARGGTRAVRWAAPRLRSSGKGPVRFLTWTITVAGRSPVRFVRWTARHARAGFLASMDAAAGLLDRHPKTRPLADRIRTATGRTGMTCGYCGAQLRADTAERHMDAHNAEATRKDDPVRAGTRPTVVPIRPRSAPAGADRPASPTAVAPQTFQKPATATASPSTTTRNPTTAGGTMSATGTTETQQLLRAANGVGEMDPGSAWELDAQLVGMARAALVLTENLGQYVETLDRIKTDPRVTAQAGVAVGQVAELVQTFSQARHLFRQLYAAQFAAAEQGVRQITKTGFFDPRNAA